MKTNDNHLSSVWFHVTDLVVDHGQGCYVYTTDGQKYLDFTSGIGVTNTGHSHPRVVKAIQEQTAKFIHAQVNIYTHEPLIHLANTLNTITPDPIDTFFFSNSGAEAVEGAVKLAKHYTGRPNIIVFQGGYHGRTAQTMAMTTSKTVYRLDYQPLPGGIFVAPFPYVYHYGWPAEEATKWALDELNLILHSQTAPQETAAMIIEPVLGEGGYIPAPREFLEGVRRICDEHNILLIFDEIQTGFGRTGKMFALEHSQVVPDIITMAKGLGSGFPISAVGSSQHIMSRWQTGTHGGTYGGNPIGCAAAKATIQVLQEEGLVQNAAERGEQLVGGLVEIQDRYPVLGDVRGLGLMIGCEFTYPDTKQPAKDVASKVRANCQDNKLILMGCGTYGNTLRWIPPLIVTEAQINEGLTIFEEALNAAVKTL